MNSLACPLCRQPLAVTTAGARCPQGHAFDRAREGYLNLLPVQQKKSRAPGDNDTMVRARRDFLAAGHYAPLRKAMVARLLPLQANTLLDIGCGEGWYTAAFATCAPETVGLDLAKEAVRFAAKHFSGSTGPGITWLVAGSAALPLADASVDVITSLFSPLTATEVARVLKPGGRLLLVTPGEAHLRELRAYLFDEVRPHRPDKFVTELAPAFKLQAQHEIAFPLALDSSSLENLLAMTPYAWRATREKREALLARGGLATGAELVVLEFMHR